MRFCVSSQAHMCVCSMFMFASMVSDVIILYAEIFECAYRHTVKIKI